MLKLLWLGLMCLVLSMACVGTPSPTPTPLPPVIGFMLGTPFPTDTPRPPTHTPDSTAIANARATITAINRALPTPASTPMPTFTPAPTSTPTPTPTPTPTATPTSTPAPTPTPTPNPTPTPTATPTAVPTPTPTRTPRPTSTPTPTPVPWDTYQHSKDVSKFAGLCKEELDFKIQVPPGWVTDASTCESVKFESRDEKGIVRVLSKHLPNYSGDRAVAFREITKDYGKDYTLTSLVGGEAKVRVLSSRPIKHDGHDALYQSLHVDATYFYCDESRTRLIAPSKTWSSSRATKRVFIVTTIRCKIQGQHTMDMERMLGSFRQFRG